MVVDNVDQTADLNAMLSTAFTIEEERILDAPSKTLKALNLTYKIRTSDFGSVAPHGTAYEDGFDSNKIWYSITPTNYVTYAFFLYI